MRGETRLNHTLVCWGVRGTGTVTRCPLELQLRRGDVEVAELSYTKPGQPEVRIDKLSYADIADAVLRATDDVAGVGAKTLVDTPLSLKVYGPLLHDLTLIDLPGIIVSPLPGGKHVQHIIVLRAPGHCAVPGHTSRQLLLWSGSCPIPLALNHMDLRALQASRQTSRISR